MNGIVRLPDPQKIDEFLRDAASVEKLKKPIRQALAALKPEDQKAVAARFVEEGGGKPLSDYLAKSKGAPDMVWEKGALKFLIEEIGRRGPPGLTTHPGHSGLRPLNSTETKILAEAIQTIERLVADITTKKYDTCLGNVFGEGPAVIKEASDRFAMSLTVLLRLHKEGKIVVDLMQKETVWKCGGLTSDQQIALPDSMAIDEDKTLTITTLVHEMTHALPLDSRTSDKYYRGMDGFPRARVHRKLQTADYYAEVFHRILEGTLPGDKYVPLDSSEKANMPDAALVQYKKRVTDLVLKAWGTAINIHDSLAKWGEYSIKRDQKYIKLLMPNAMDPEHLAFLRTASQVLGLTIHKRGTLTGARNEITQLDLSIVDNKINVLARLIGSIKKAVNLPAQDKIFEEAKVNFVLKEALRAENQDKERPGLLSRDIEKDVIVIRSLAELNSAPGWQTFLSDLAKGLPDSMKNYSKGSIHL